MEGTVSSINNASVNSSQSGQASSAPKADPRRDRLARPASPMEGTFLPYAPTRTYPTVPDIAGLETFYNIIAEEKRNWVSNFVDRYNDPTGTPPLVNGLPHDPSRLAELPSGRDAEGAVSEGVGYGLLLSVLTNDQDLFDRIFTNAMDCMYDLNGTDMFAWITDRYNRVLDSNSATDADIDIALALIFAWKLVQSGYWSASPAGYDYYATAQDMVNAIARWGIDENGYLTMGDIPGGDSGGADLTNPSYFAPYAFRIFDEFEETDHHEIWADAIYKGYRLIDHANFSNGLVPDWTDHLAHPYASHSDTPVYFNGSYWSGISGKEAIRTYWRVGLDVVFNADRLPAEDMVPARQFLDRMASFYGPIAASCVDLYWTNGTAYDHFDDGYAFYNIDGQHSPRSVAMIGAGAMGTDNATLQHDFAYQAASLYNPPAGSIPGYAWVPGDASYRDKYYEQSLHLLGLLSIGGLFWDVYHDLGGGNPVIETEDHPAQPERCSIVGNRPNPANPATAIRIEAKQPGTYTLGIYDLLGKKVREYSGYFNKAGQQEIIWDGHDMNQQEAPSGIYLSVLMTSQEQATHKFQLVR